MLEFRDGISIQDIRSMGFLFDLCTAIPSQLKPKTYSQIFDYLNLQKRAVQAAKSTPETSSLILSLTQDFFTEFDS